MSGSFHAMRFVPLALLTGVIAAFAWQAPAIAASSSLIPQYANLVTTGVGPIAVGFNTNTNRVYVANLGSLANPASSVTVLDGTTDEVLATIPVSDTAPPNGYLSGAGALAVDETHNLIYVDMNNGALVTIDGATNAQINSFTFNINHTNAFSNGMVMSNKTGYIYYLAQGQPGGTNTIIVFNPATQTVVAQIDDEDESFIAIDQSTNTIYVTNYFGATLWVINGNTNELTDIISGIGVPFAPDLCWLGRTPCVEQGSEIDGVAVDETLHRVYTFGSQGGLVATIDSTTNSVLAVKYISSNQPFGAVDPANHAVYSISDVYGSLTVTDGTTDNIVAYNLLYYGGPAPFGIGINPATQKMYLFANQVLILKVP